jgi:hypothetical protein
MADTLSLDPAETLTGTVNRVTEGTLVFRTSLAGQIMAPMDTISALTSERNFVVTLTDGRVLYGRFVHGAEGSALVPLDGSAPAPVAYADVLEAIPIPSAAQAEPSAISTPGDQSRSAFSLETGFQWRKGNASRMEPTVRVELSLPTAGGTLETGALVERADSENFPAHARAEARWRGGGDTAPYGAAGVARDTDSALRVRAELGLGLQHLLFEDPVTRLEGAVGVGLVYEDWDTGVMEEPAGPRYWDSTRSGADVELQLRLRYSRTLFQRGQLDGQVALLPSLTDPGDFRALSDAALSYPVSPSVQVRLNLRFYYESDPPFPGLTPWETTVGAGLRFEF